MRCKLPHQVPELQLPFLGWGSGVTLRIEDTGLKAWDWGYRLQSTAYRIHPHTQPRIYQNP